MLARLSWDVTTQLHYVGQVRWIRKQNTQHHSFGWEATVIVWLGMGKIGLRLGGSRLSLEGGGGVGKWTPVTGPMYGPHCLLFCFDRCPLSVGGS